MTRTRQFIQQFDKASLLAVFQKCASFHASTSEPSQFYRTCQFLVSDELLFQKCFSFQSALDKTIHLFQFKDGVFVLISDFVRSCSVLYDPFVIFHSENKDMLQSLETFTEELNQLVRQNNFVTNTTWTLFMDESNWYRKCYTTKFISHTSSDTYK